MSVLKHIALIVGILAIPCALLIGIRFMSPAQEVRPPTAIELIATLFAAVTIVLGALAVVIAVLAIWGYGAIKAEAKGTATDAAKKAAVEHIESEEVQARLREESRKIIGEEVKKIQEGMALAESQPAQGKTTQSVQGSKRVGKRYSKDKEG